MGAGLSARHRGAEPPTVSSCQAEALHRVDVVEALVEQRRGAARGPAAHEQVVLVGRRQRGQRRRVGRLPTSGSSLRSVEGSPATSPSSTASAVMRRHLAAHGAVALVEVVAAVGSSSGQSTTSARGYGSSGSHASTRIRRVPTATTA